MKHRAKHSCKLHCQGDVGVWCANVGRTQGRSRCLLRFVKVSIGPRTCEFPFDLSTCGRRIALLVFVAGCSIKPVTRL